MKTEKTTETEAPSTGVVTPAADVWQDASKQDSATEKETANAAAPTAETHKPKGYLANTIGKWAHEHKDYMSNNWLPWYGLRNAAASVFGITALVTILVPTRFGFGKLRSKAAETLKQNPDSKLARFAQTTFNGLTENIIGTGLSFAGFRTGYKLWQRNYDRIFTKAPSEEDSAQAVSNLPENIASDLHYLAPVEFPATLIAAVPLVAMRSGMRLHGNEFNKAALPRVPGKPQLFEIKNPATNQLFQTDAGGLVAAGQDSRVKDVIGCIPAYTAFFEFGERMFDDFQTRRGYSKNEHSHVKGVLHPSEQSKEKKPFDTMLEDTPARMYFYKVASVAAGIIPYITWSRYAQNNKGWQMKPTDSVWKAWSKEQGMYQGFALYTVGSELTRNNIDKLFQRLQDKELEKQGITK